MRESERILVQTFDTLKLHYENPSTTTNCSKCSYSCRNEIELKEHTETVHTQIFACISCTFVSKSNTDFAEHLKSHCPRSESTKVSCEVCGAEGSSRDIIQKHIEEMHTCQVCKSLYKDVYELNRKWRMNMDHRLRNATYVSM